MIKNILNFKSQIFLVFIGLLLGISFYFIPLKYVLLLTSGIVGMVLVIWKLEIGIYVAIFLLPFMPTMTTVGLTLIIILSFIIKVIKYDKKINFSPLSLWIIMFAGVTIVDSIFSITPMNSLKIAVVILSYLSLYFVIINTITSKKMIYTLLLTLLCSATLQSLYGLYQYKIGITTIYNNWTDPELFPEMETRVFGTLDNPNILAQYLELLLPLALGLFWSVKNYFKKTISLGMSFIMILCLILTGSRGGWIAFAIAMIVFGILKDRRIILIGIVLGLISINFLPPSIINRAMSITNLGEASNSYRIFLWQESFNIIKDYWISGVGVGTEAFQKVYTSYYIREGVFAFHSHNLYIQTLIETGILGLLSLLTIIFVTFRNGIQTLINSEDHLTKTIIAALLGGLTGFLFHGITEYSFYNFKIVFLFWTVISLIMSIREMNIGIKHIANENNFEN